MIVDDIHNWEINFTNPVWQAVFTEIKSLNGHTLDMEKKILNDDIILKVFSYETLTLSDQRAELESHRKYIDVHTTVSGSERIDWYPISVLSTKGSYSAIEDAIYYGRKEQPWASINMYPGIFAAFWPEDAHMPRIMTGEKSSLIKKAVVKIKVDLVSF
ncbi:MAG: YhcH/YjgK/YiaL family protein [Smithellaceae bacterium]